MSLNPIIKAYGQPFKGAYKKIERYIKEAKAIVVYRHIKPDFDALGTQMGLVTFLKDNFPDKEIRFVGDDHVSFTPRLFPVSERLPASFYESKKFLAIIVDVGDDSRIADPRYKEAEHIVKFDHHPYKEQVAEVEVLDLEAGAASEIVVDFCLHFKGTRISKEAARYFYIGLVGDTGCFRYPSTSMHTLTVAGELMASGIDHAKIIREMFQKKLDDLRSQAYVLNHFYVSEHGVAYYTLPSSVQKELDITPERGKENVNIFSNIEGIGAWCSITEDPDPKDYCWRVSIRSKEKDISGVAQKWGGGGHKNASGARIDDIKDLDKFIADLDALFA